MSRDNESPPKVSDNGNDSKLQKRIEETVGWALLKALNPMMATLQEMTKVAIGGSGGKW